MEHSLPEPDPDDLDTSETPLSEAEAAEIEDRLRTLGYIE